MMKISIKSMMFNIFLALWTIIISLSIVPFYFTKNLKIISILGSIWAKITIKALYFICDIKYNITGTENIPNTNLFIIASKHQSAWETIFFLQYFKLPVYILKKELTKIPFYGWFLTSMGMIAIDRKGGIKSLKKVLLGVENALSKNRPVVIFPEGTRVKPMTSVKYQSGIAAIYNKFRTIPIIPIAVNSGLYWPKNSWNKFPGTIKVQILKPINPSLKKEEFLTNLKNDIEQASNKLYTDLQK